VSANAARGEAMVAGHVLRPSFSALVAAEAELGPLFALVERAADGRLGLGEMVALFWHCRVPVTPAQAGAGVESGRTAACNTTTSPACAGVTGDRDAFAEAVTAQGLAAATPALRLLLAQILSGQ
jgi:Phage tail tube protein, GTA-gp10